MYPQYSQTDKKSRISAELPHKLTHKQILNRRRHAFLLTFFDLPHKYEFKEVNGFILVRQYNASADFWEVAIYDKDTWKNTEQYRLGT